MSSWVAFYLPSGMVSDLNWSWFGCISFVKTTQPGGRYMLRTHKRQRRKRTLPPFIKNPSTILIPTSASGRSKASSFSNHHTRKLTSKGQYVRWGSYERLDTCILCMTDFHVTHTVCNKVTSLYAKKFMDSQSHVLLSNYQIRNSKI